MEAQTGRITSGFRRRRAAGAWLLIHGQASPAVPDPARSTDKGMKQP